MRSSKAFILSCFLILTALSTRAQFDAKQACRIEDGRLVFTLDLQWTPAQRKQFASTYDLDSVVIAGAYALKPSVTVQAVTWTVRRTDARHIELSRQSGQKSTAENSKHKIFLLDDNSVDLITASDRASVPYGLNHLTRNTVQQVSPGKVRFYMPGHKNARSVCLSGSFNGWGTHSTPMQQCDSGWVAVVKLLPGKYNYKFIVDGKWLNDSYNRLREDDGNSGYNNIFFCYNYRFVLNGFSDAKKVVVSGSFNNWNPSELRMIRYRDTWLLPLYLREGTHAYKFVVDNQWINDPASKVIHPDGHGNKNSYVGIGDTMYFRLKGFQKAANVAVAGNFNAWNPNELLMQKSDGGWLLPYVLAPGNYEYKFVVDGQWTTDPANPFRLGEGEGANSFLAVQPTHTFRLEKYQDAKKVFLTGSFNGWNNPGYRMSLNDGVWYFPICLKPGKYLYKFIVESKWILDPGNDLWEDNEYGTGNSVLWIEQ